MFLTQFFKADFSPKLYEIRLFTAVVSLLLSTWAFALDDLINSDGVLYMNMVRALIEGGFSSMAELYNWPFFSMLVAGIHLITGLPLETSGNLLNILMFVIFTDALILICHKMLPNTRQVFIAALFILGFTLLNDYRAYLFRDLGYWAFMGLALYQFIRFLELPNWTNGLLWQLWIVIAILFRVEGVVIFTLLPLFIFYTTDSLKVACKQIMILWSAVAIVSVLAIAILLSQTGLAVAFGKIAEIYTYIDLSNVFEEFQQQSDVINTQIMSVFDKESGTLILASGLIAVIIERIISAIGIVYLIYYLVSRFSKHAPAFIQSHYRQLFMYFIAINFFILTIFVFKQYFLSTRYGVMLVTTLFLLMLPRFCTFVEQAIIHRRKGILAFTAFMIIAGPIDSLTSSVSKAYIKETALWAAAELPADSRTLTLDTITDYYIRENNGKTDLHLSVGADPLATTGYDFLIVTIRHREPEMAETLSTRGFTTVFEASNARGDLARIVKVPE